MRLPRFRIGTLLIAVALAGVVAGGVALWRRSGDYARRASLAEFRQELYAESVTSHEEYLEEDGHTLTQSEMDRCRLNMEELRARRDYHASLKLKYRGASLRPWLSVEPGPPEPPWHVETLPVDPRTPVLE